MATNNSSNMYQLGLQSNDSLGNIFGRQLVPGSSKISIVNPDGIASDPILDILPANILINDLGGAPLSASNGGTGVSSPTANAIPIAEGSSAFQFVTLNDGQLLIGSTGLDPVAAPLAAGAGVSIATGPGSITISATAETITWHDVTSTAEAMLPSNGYLSNNASLVTLTLPTTANQFSTIIVAGNGAGGWEIAQNTGQTINFESLSTTSGAGGKLASTNKYDSVTLICTVADTTWSVVNAMGNITVV